jgi:predicted nucleic acid-binding protein
MILLDTNVVSEPLRRAPDARVTEWIDAQALETLFLSSVTVAEPARRVHSTHLSKLART